MNTGFDGNNPQNPDPLQTFEKNVGHLGNGDWTFNTSMKPPSSHHPNKYYQQNPLTKFSKTSPSSNLPTGTCFDNISDYIMNPNNTPSLQF